MLTAGQFSGYSTDQLLQLLLNNLTGLQESGYSTDQLLQFLVNAVSGYSGGGGGGSNIITDTNGSGHTYKVIVTNGVMGIQQLS